MPHKVENLVRKGENACYKQFVLFSQFFFTASKSLVDQNLALCANGLSCERHSMGGIFKIPKNLPALYCKANPVLLLEISVIKRTVAALAREYRGCELPVRPQ